MSTEHLHEEWTSSIYVFYALELFIGHEGGHCYHALPRDAEKEYNVTLTQKMPNWLVTCESMQGRQCH